jgi:hypothetical protein
MAPWLGPFYFIDEQEMKERILEEAKRLFVWSLARSSANTNANSAPSAPPINDSRPNDWRGNPSAIAADCLSYERSATPCS